MIIVNRIVNILILLAAIAAAVFSYMLFSKREKLLDGWKQMASAIQTTAKTLDDGGASGTTAARDLPEDKMLHNNYDQLNQVLPKLNKNVKDLVVQRNELARAMCDVASTLRISGVTNAGLRNIGSYKDQERILLTNTRTFRSISDSVSQEYSNTGSIFGVSTPVGQLRSSATYRTATKKINDAARDAVNRRNNYQRYLLQFSRDARVRPPNLQVSSYNSNLAAVSRQIRGKLAELDKANNLLKREQNLTKNLRTQIVNKNKTIAARDKVINNKNIEIQRLNNILSKDGTITLPVKLLTAADKECYSYVRGKVQYVDRDYGFVTINIGSNYTFAQQYGIKKNVVLFPLKKDNIMTVVRISDNGEQKIIGKVRVTKVDVETAVCNLIDGKPELYRAGDEVIYTDDDVAVITKGKK